MLSNWCFASGLYHVVSMNWKIDHANTRKSLFPIYIYIWFSQLEISIYKRVLENINEYKRFPIATFDYRRVFVSRLACCIPSAQFPWITMGSAVVTAQDYYDVSDTEAGSDDFAVRWGEKKMDAGHRWTLWTGPGVRMRGKTRTIE